MKDFPYYLIVGFLLILSSCEFADTGKAKPLNPNGDSELALMMREMYEDGQRMKKEVLAGNKPEVLEKFRQIHEARATEPEKIATEQYRLYADAYLNALQILDNSGMEELESSYSAVVESCMNCHRAVCPGPMVRIEKLRLPALLPDN